MAFEESAVRGREWGLFHSTTSQIEQQREREREREGNGVVFLFKMFFNLSEVALFRLLLKTSPPPFPKRSVLMYLFPTRSNCQRRVSCLLQVARGLHFPIDVDVTVIIIIIIIIFFVI